MHALPELGVGLVLWPELMPVLDEDDGAIGVVEIEPEFFWFETGNAQAPMRIDTGMVRQLAELPHHKLVHGVASPVGGSLAPDPRRLRSMREVVQALGAPWASEHLSFNAVPVAGGPVDSGFLLPPLQTVEGAHQAAANIRAMAHGLQVPFAVENNVNYLRPVDGELSDGAFIAEVVTQADCGILLDLHNLWTNERNGRQPVREALAALPLERVCELHLAGGFAHRGYWLDAHSGLVDQELMRLAAELVPALPKLRAIVFEMLPSYLPQVGIAAVRRQLDGLHSLWALRRPGARLPHPEPVVCRTGSDATPSPGDWERTLGALVRGDAPEAHPVAALIDDPGVALLRELASNARAGQIASAARLTTRMLLAHGGEAAFRTLFDAYAAAQPPRQFASSEALGFLEHVQRAAPAIPRLAQVVMFESAVIHSALCGDTRTVAFDGDPVPLLTALAERRVPPPTQAPGSVTIELQRGAVTAIRAR
ncbi:DUF692 domain-containing protein [Xanthomonas bundabergensis]|uniref:DUF692 domain-containing protein n=1 Tax=Xanthomonas bundabergensis TaxID=3160842 RepID=UPI0035185C6A